jgi:hypothetical protein
MTSKIKAEAPARPFSTRARTERIRRLFYLTFSPVPEYDLLGTESGDALFHTAAASRSDGGETKRDFMGLDQSYLAIRHDRRVIESAVGARIPDENLGPLGLDESEQPKPEAGDEILGESQSATAIEDSRSKEDREVDIDRRWDVLYYLLSENRRRCLPADEDDWAYRAVFGARMLGDEIRAMQGVPIRYTRADEIWEIYERLDAVQVESLAEHWNPAAMSEAGVYKMRPETDDGKLELVIEDFENLKNLYLWAFAYEEGVLVFCD